MIQDGFTRRIKTHSLAMRRLSNNTNYKEIMSHIKISATVARWIVSLGRTLVQEGYGLDPRGEGGLEHLPEHAPDGGFLNEIPMENAPLYFWADALVRFARVLAGIAAYELQNGLEIEVPLLQDDISEI